MLLLSVILAMVILAIPGDDIYIALAIPEMIDDGDPK